MSTSSTRPPAQERPFGGMAWAVDAESRRPVYVGSLPRERTGLRCACVCPACDARLQAVGAGRDASEGHKVPFFRHHFATQGPGCKHRVAELAALKLLAEQGLIEIPAPRKPGKYVGLSGRLYDGVAVGEPVHERVVERRLLSDVGVLLTLESGRQVALVLRGYQNVGELGSVFAVIEVHVEDPDVAWMSPEEILANSKLAHEWLCLVSHQDDRKVQQLADDDARRRALEHLDIDPAELDLPAGATKKQASESLLHWAIKSALAEIGRLVTPAYTDNASAVDSEGKIHTVPFGLPSSVLALSEVVDEVLFEGYRPDIIGLASDPAVKSGPFRLLVEVAVTNRVQAAKLALIRKDDVACIELDVARFSEGGEVSLAELRRMVAEDLGCKQWLHHPAIAALRAEAQRSADAARDEANELAAERRRVDALRRRIEEERHALEVRGQAEQMRLQVEKQERERRRVEGMMAWAVGLDQQAALRELRQVLERRWSGDLEITSNGMLWNSRQFEAAVMDVLPRPLLGKRIVAQGGIASRLCSIVRASRPDADPLDFDAVVSLEGGLNEAVVRSWYGVIHLAIDTLGAPIDPLQLESHAKHRQHVLADLHGGGRRFARVKDVDEALATMFPELAEVLALALGTVSYCDMIELERSAADAEAQRARGVAQHQAALEIERRRLPELIAQLGFQLVWKANPKVPPSPDEAVKYLSIMGLGDVPDRIVDLVRDGWRARGAGELFGVWLEACELRSVEEVELARRALEAAFLVKLKVSK